MFIQTLLLPFKHLVCIWHGKVEGKRGQEKGRMRDWKSGIDTRPKPTTLKFIPQGNCITYWSMFPASNGHGGWNCWWQLGNSYESNKESLRHKTQVSHLCTFHLPLRGPLSAGYMHSVCSGWGSLLTEELRSLKQWVHRLRRAFVSITALALANKQGRQTIILHYIHDYSALHFLAV